MTAVMSAYLIVLGIVLVAARNKLGASASDFYRRFKLPAADSKTYAAFFAIGGIGSILFGVGSLLFSYVVH